MACCSRKTLRGTNSFGIPGLQRPSACETPVDGYKVLTNAHYVDGSINDIALKCTEDPECKEFTPDGYLRKLCGDTSSEVGCVYKKVQGSKPSVKEEIKVATNVHFDAKAQHAKIHVPQTGVIDRVRLIHIKGKVACYGAASDSNWGLSGDNPNNLAMYIVDEKNNVLLPNHSISGFTGFINNNGYGMTGAHPNDKQLVFNGAINVMAGQTLRLYYCEVFRKEVKQFDATHDNRGEVHCDVYFRYTAELQVGKNVPMNAVRGFGTFQVPHMGTISRMRLVHLSGQVTASVREFSRSFWGVTGSHPSHLAVYIVDEENNILFPNPTNHGFSGFINNNHYAISGAHPTDPELVFSGAINVTAGQTLRLYYSEVYRTEVQKQNIAHDNDGEVLCNIFVTYN